MIRPRRFELFFVYLQKSPIKLPKEPEVKKVIQEPEEVKQVIQPDVIPAQHSQPAVPPPAAFTNDFVVEDPVEEEEDDVIVKPPDEQLYSNVNKRVEQETNIKSVVETVNEPQSPIKEQNPVTTTASNEINEHIDPIYQNQEDLTEYIEDTGVKAVNFLNLFF